MSQFLDSIKTVKNNYSKYDTWEQEQADERAQKEFLAKTLDIPQDKIDLTSKKAQTVIRATEIMDRYSEDNCEDMEQATGILSALALIFTQLLGEGTGTVISDRFNKNIKKKIKDIETVLSDTNLTEDVKSLKTKELNMLNNKLLKFNKNFPMQKVIGNTIISIFIAGSLILWGNSKQKEASRIGRWQAKQNELKDYRNFVLYTPEQLAKAEELAKSIPDPKERNAIVKMIKELTAVVKDKKAYEKWVASKDPNEIEKLKSLNYTPEKLKAANEDKELIVDAVKEINIKAEEYSENVENAFDTLGTLSWLIAAPAGFLINSVLKLVKVPGKYRAVISTAIPTITSLTLLTSGTIVQKEASRVGRYVARKDLTSNTARLMAYTDEDMEKAKDIKAQPVKKSVLEKVASSFTFLNQYMKDAKEYTNYRKTVWKNQEKMQQAFSQIDITETQKKEAKQLQQKVFRAFDEIDEMSQRYSEDIEAGSDIAKNIVGNIWGLGTGAAAVLLPVLFSKGKVPISRIVNTITNAGLKKESSLRIAVNSLYNELKKDKKLMQEFQRSIISGDIGFFLQKQKAKDISVKFNNLINELGTITPNLQAGTTEDVLNKHLKNGPIAKWVRNLITESISLYTLKKSPELAKTMGLTLDWKKYKTLIGTGATAGVASLGGIISVPYIFNAWLTDIQKKAGKIGIMKAMEKIDDPRVFADLEEKEEKLQTIASLQKKADETNLLKLAQ